MAQIGTRERTARQFVRILPSVLRYADGPFAVRLDENLAFLVTALIDATQNRSKRIASGSYPEQIENSRWNVRLSNHDLQ